MKLFQALSFASIFWLSGCMSSVLTHVDAYSAIPADIEPKTVYIAPYDKSDADSLEWQANARTLASVLSDKGFQTVARRSDATLIAYFGFAVDNGERVQSTYSIPQWGVTGYSGARTYGTVYGNSVSATTTYTPTYGVTGYKTETIEKTIFTRSLYIDMIEIKSGKKVFESKAVSSGSCNSFSPVAIQIISAVLSEFPSGKSGKISLPYDGKC